MRIVIPDVKGVGMRVEAVSAGRRAVNVTLPAGLVEEARTLGLNLSRACEAGLTAMVQAARQAQWRTENRAALDSWEAWDAVQDSPLAPYRGF